MFVRTPDGWVTVPWTHLPMVSAPFAEFTWRHARKLAAKRGRDDTNETEVARVLDDLLTRAQAGRGGQGHRPGRGPHPGRRGRAPPATPARNTPGEPATATMTRAAGQLATVIPFGVFDADAEAARW